jgi:hypothetical protein
MAWLFQDVTLDRKAKELMAAVCAEETGRAGVHASTNMHRSPSSRPARISSTAFPVATIPRR